MYFEKINAQDEILDTSGQLDSKPRYRIRDNNGTILYDNVTLEVATPVTQEGTAIDKALFDKIDGALALIVSKDNGEDFKKYIETGEYGGIKTPDILDPLYELKDLWQKEIESKISSLDTRVTALEKASST